VLEDCTPSLVIVRIEYSLRGLLDFSKLHHHMLDGSMLEEAHSSMSADSRDVALSESSPVQIASMNGFPQTKPPPSLWFE
jgi:hypothetical protein